MTYHHINSNQEKVSRIFVITAPMIGKNRLKKFHQNIAKYPYRIPRVEVIEGVNKNDIDFRHSPEYALSFKDKRSIWHKTKLKLNLSKNAIDFHKSNFKWMFSYYGKAKQNIGTVGAFVGHVKAWMKVAKNEKPCLIMEDDSLLNYSIDLSHFVPPSEDSYMITLLPQYIYHNKKNYSHDYWLVEDSLEAYMKRKEDHQNNPKQTNKQKYPLGNHGAGAYIITPKAAQYLINQLPVPIIYDVDTWLLYRSGLKIYAYKKECINPIITLSLISPNSLMKRLKLIPKRIYRKMNLHLTTLTLSN